MLQKHEVQQMKKCKYSDKRLTNWVAYKDVNLLMCHKTACHVIYITGCCSPAMLPSQHSVTKSKVQPGGISLICSNCALSVDEEKCHLDTPKERNGLQ